jgi:hypothetical protein
MGEMAILSPEGSQNITWNPGNSDEIQNVEYQFRLYLDQGYSAFHMSDTGGEGKMITAFNALAEKIIMVPKLGGG